MKRPLESYYSGDTAWRANVELALQRWTDSEQQIQLLGKLDGDKDLAAVVDFKMPEGALEWLVASVPALDGRKPINCLGSPNLVLRLREALMRMD